MKSLAQILVATLVLAFTSVALSQSRVPFSEIRLQSTARPDNFVRKMGENAFVNRTASEADVQSSVLRVVSGLNGRGISFQVANEPDVYLVARNRYIRFQRNDGTPTFAANASFIERAALSGARDAVSFELASGGDFLRQCGGMLVLDRLTGGTVCGNPVANLPSEASFKVDRVASQPNVASTFPALNKAYRIKIDFQSSYSRYPFRCLDGNFGETVPVNDCNSQRSQMFRFTPAGPSGAFRIHPMHLSTEICLEARPSEVAGGPNSLAMTQCKASNAQLWRVVPANGGLYRIENLRNGDNARECLQHHTQVRHGAGYLAVTNACGAGAGQEWHLEEQ